MFIYYYNLVKKGNSYFVKLPPAFPHSYEWGVRRLLYQSPALNSNRVLRFKTCEEYLDQGGVALSFKLKNYPSHNLRLVNLRRLL